MHNTVLNSITAEELIISSLATSIITNYRMPIANVALTVVTIAILFVRLWLMDQRLVVLALYSCSAYNITAMALIVEVQH